jgi:hypothetical protein
MAARATPVANGLQSAVLIRSQIVGAWPGLQITATLAGAPLAVVRDAVLAPSVRLVIFAGVPDTVTLAQPYQGLLIGVNEDGTIAPRSVTTAPIGAPLDVPAVTPQPRGSTAGVLDIAGLAATLATATGASSFGAGDLAIQLVVAPESQGFTPGGS